MNTSRQIKFAFIASTILACSSSSSATDMSIAKTCLRTQCDAYNDNHNRACSECNDACFSASYGCDVSNACNDACGPAPACSDDLKNTCDQTGFKVTMPTDASADIASACRKEIARDTACGQSYVSTAADCDLFALTELPARASAYSCVAALACNADETPCAPAMSTFGTDLCAKGDMACGTNNQFCDNIAKGLSDYLNVDGAWLRPDVIATADSCVAQSTCSDVTQCMTAWLQAVLPQ